MIHGQKNIKLLHVFKPSTLQNNRYFSVFKFMLHFLEWIAGNIFPLYSCICDGAWTDKEMRLKKQAEANSRSQEAD